MSAASSATVRAAPASISAARAPMLAYCVSTPVPAQVSSRHRLSAARATRVSTWPRIHRDLA
ncbi:hypothetical protein [Streptomyces sp. NPDC059018]|uniref:hypothetical protein n=1 Tax=Streptomyces sp. NPDC059018 TaxID=3346701 RepID=UPI00369E719B